MFWEILKFELKYRLTRPATYLYFIIFLVLSFAAVSSENITIGSSSEKVFKNAAVVIYNFSLILSAFGIMVTSAVMGVPVYRDIEHKTSTFFFSLPIKESSYLGGRFVGSFLVLMFIFSSISIGIMLGSIMPWLPAERVGPTLFLNHLQGFFWILIPNIFFSACILFSLVTITRNIMAAYLGSVILLVGYLISVTLLQNLDNETLAAFLDPFGFSAMGLVTRYWTIPEQNIGFLPMSGIWLYNRMLWTGVGVIFLLITFNKFSFSQLTSAKIKKKVAPIESFKTNIALPVVNKAYGFSLNLKNLFRLSGLELRNAVGNVFFVALFLAMIIFMFLDGFQGDQKYGTYSVPVTYLMTEIRAGNFILLALIILIFYTGETVFKERSLKLDQLMDVLPTPNWVLYGSKLLSMIYIVFLMCTSVIFVGVTVQTISGYFNYEFGVYFSDLYLITFPKFAQLAVFIFFVMIMVNNKFAGYGIVMLYWLGQIGLGLMGHSHNLFSVGSIPRYIYSDMNGFGHYVEPIFWFSSYWTAFVLMLTVLGNVFWPRGAEFGFKSRWKLAKERFTTPAKISFATFLLLVLGIGYYIVYNTFVLNDYRSSDQRELDQVNYELTYKKYENLVQPKIADIFLDVEIYPESREVDILGKFKMQNRAGVNIDTLMLNVENAKRFKGIKWNGEGLEPSFKDDEYDIIFYTLPQPLAPEAYADFEFDMNIGYDGFANEVGSSVINYNGTFFNTSVLPQMGYSDGYELSSEEKRKKHDLAPKPRSKAIDDPVGKMTSFISDDADFVNFEAEIGTSGDQIAIAPGYLQKEWQENGRKYFHYKTDAPGFYFFAILSARYEVLTDEWTSPEGEKVKLEVYHHKGHTRNLDRMIDGMKRSLDYYGKNYSPYQHRQLRILEFPRYRTFAQSFANTVPFAESFGFIADFSDEEDIDYVYYVTAHEVAHQWWGHQVMPRATNGAGTVSEMMSQYSALMVMEDKYGEDKINKFLEYELDRYLRSRTRESKYEPSLIENEGLAYIYYQKGSVATYALKDMIGEDALNAALKAYVDSVAFQKPPFTSSRELYSYMYNATPDSLKYFTEDLFQKRILYDNRLTDAVYEKKGDENYVLTLKFAAKKLEADSAGNESEVESMADWIDIGVFVKDKDAKPLYFKKHKLTPGEHTLELNLREEPSKAGIDPYHKLIDRVPDDNIKSVSEKGALI